MPAAGAADEASDGRSAGAGGPEDARGSNEPPPCFSGLKPAEFKAYRKRIKLWRLFTRTPLRLQGPRVLSRLTDAAWDACEGLDPDDVAGEDGVGKIMRALREAFQAEAETELFDALEEVFYSAGRK